MSKHEERRVNCRSRRGHLAAIRMGFATILCATLPAGRAADLQWAPDKPDVIAFKPVTAKYVRLTLTGAGTPPGLDEVEILAPNGKDNLALASTGAKATAKSCLEGFTIHQIAHLNDGKYGNDHSWIAADADTQWIMIELPKAAEIVRVVVSRDREGRFSDRTAGYIEVDVSEDGKTFTSVAKVGSVAAARNAGPVDRMAEQSPARPAISPDITAGQPVPPPVPVATADEKATRPRPTVTERLRCLQLMLDGGEVRWIRVGLPQRNSVNEIEIFTPASRENLALATKGAVAGASSHDHDPRNPSVRHISFINDGRYGSGSAWQAHRDDRSPWVEIALPQPVAIGRIVVSTAASGSAFPVFGSVDGKSWTELGALKRADLPADRLPKGLTAELASTFVDELATIPLENTLGQLDQMIERFAGRGLDVTDARKNLAALQERLAAFDPGRAWPEEALALFYEIRLAKRDLFLRDPDLAPIEHLVFVKRHPYVPSHNYSDFMDGRLQGGGGVYRLDIPREQGRFVPEKGQLASLFQAGQGIARDVALDWSGQNLWFAYMREARGGYVVPGEGRNDPSCAAVTDGHRWHLYKLNLAGGQAQEMTTGPHHDYYPCVLPDGDIGFVTTRCNMRFLCWVPTTMALYRMKPDGTEIRPISRNNLSEWGPTIMRDGRIMWTRSEYQDKGADYGHTLWAIHPDGSHPELVYGNNTPHNIMNAMEVPGKAQELLATKISHFGDFNGPICYIDLKQGPYDPNAMKTVPYCGSDTSNGGIYRDPWPIATDLFLCSHKDGAHFSLYVMDRFGNRELLHRDPSISCMTPQPLAPRSKPPVLATVPSDGGQAEMTLIDVYDGLNGAVERGRIKWLRICRELPSFLELNSHGVRRETYGDFRKYYASPNDRVTSRFGWPAYVAKEVVGLVPVEADGSAHFTVPANTMFYFQALDENFTEIQRMRSVIQAVPGEKRSCLGCHDDRQRTGSPPKFVTAMSKPAATPQPPPWGAGPFWYERAVQPVLDRRCTECHDGTQGAKKLDLTGRTIPNDGHAPASYVSLIRGGYVHFADVSWGQQHRKMGPLTLGTPKSSLFTVLAGKEHEKVKLTTDEIHAIKCWIDLNCPLWGDYQHRDERAARKTLATAHPVGLTVETSK